MKNASDAMRNMNTKNKHKHTRKITDPQTLLRQSNLRCTSGRIAILEVLTAAKRPLSQEDYESLPPEAAYNPFHSSQLYVLGGDGELLDIIGYGSTPSQIEETLRKYL